MDTNGHYRVVRSPHGGDIERLVCGHCRFVVFLRPHGRGTDRSGLPKYNRARAAMVRHLHAAHRDALAAGPIDNGGNP